MVDDVVLEIPGIPSFLWSHTLTDGEVIVGRGVGCGISLTHNTVSRQHAQISRNGGQLTVKDEASSNGTYLNGVKLPPYTYSPFACGDRLTFGAVHMQVLGQAAITARNAEWQTRSTAEIQADPVVDDVLAGIETLGTGPLRVLPLLLRGYAEKEIAAKLHRSFSTVHSHVQTILRHFGVSSTKKLFALLIDRSLLAEATDAAEKTHDRLPILDD